MVSALAHAGYKVRVVERKRPNEYLSKDYYIQIEDTEQSPSFTINLTSDANANDVAKIFEDVSKLIQKSSLVNYKSL